MIRFFVLACMAIVMTASTAAAQDCTCQRRARITPVRTTLRVARNSVVRVLRFADRTVDRVQARAYGRIDRMRARARARRQR